jgi:hypothetical protein
VSRSAVSMNFGYGLELATTPRDTLTSSWGIESCRIAARKVSRYSYCRDEGDAEAIATERLGIIAM